MHHDEYPGDEQQPPVPAPDAGLADATNESTAAPPNVEEHVTAYERAMEAGAQQYAHVLNTLNEAGLPAFFTQTGGMCAAIEVTLESNRYLLVTDAENPLAWHWAEHHGWAVGLYRLPDTDDDDTIEPLRFQTTEDGSPEALTNLITEVLAPGPGEQQE